MQYCLLVEKNSIRFQATLKLTVKPRNENGVIFYIAKNNFDYFTIELHKGEVGCVYLFVF